MTDDDKADRTTPPGPDDLPTEPDEVRERLEEGRDRAMESFDESVVDLLSWVLETDTRARIYVHLRQHPDSTSDEVAEGTGLYPSTVREALAELHGEGTVTRTKRDSDGAGNNPYEYRAIPPSALVRGAIEDVQDSLNRLFTMDRDRRAGGRPESDAEPVTITVQEADDEEK